MLMSVGQPCLQAGDWMAYMGRTCQVGKIISSAIRSLEKRIPISTGGGRNPIWSRDGRELFFIEDGRQIYAVPVQAGESVVAGRRLCCSSSPCRRLPGLDHTSRPMDGS